MMNAPQTCGVMQSKVSSEGAPLCSLFCLALLLAVCGDSSINGHAQGSLNIQWETASAPSGGAKGLVELHNGQLLATRTGAVSNGVGVICSRSLDGGKSWADFSVIVRDARGTDIGDGHLLQRKNGEIWFSYRHNHYRRDKANQPDYAIRVAISRDEGSTWTLHSTVETTPLGITNLPSRGLWSSFLIEKRDGAIQCCYDDENTPYLRGFPGHQWLQMKTWNPGASQWENPVTVSRAFNSKHLSRDGMPAMVELPSGRLVCALESCDVNPPHPNVIRWVASDDGGKTWSWLHAERPILFQSAKPRFMAVSPHMTRLSDGRLLCVFATDEDRESPDRPGAPVGQFHMDVKCVISADEGRTWSRNAFTVNTEIHRDYMPGILELRHADKPNQILCLWWDTQRGNRVRRGVVLP